MLHRISIAVVAILLAGACTDRTPVSPPGENRAVQANRSTAQPLAALAKMVARGLKNPAFRAYLKAQLDASPYAEHKVLFERFLSANDGHALRQIAGQNSVSKEQLAVEAGGAIALEAYFPVPEHRAAWTGDENVLVATALTDREAPVAFDPDGRRYVLSADTPPSTPVLALVPVETDFSRLPTRMECLECEGSGGGGTTPSPAGLYMTKAHFVQDFESWLKGSPEFEVQILGQKGTTDSLVSYQCAGEKAGGPYYFDQDDKDWSGSVLLFSKTQLDQYNAAHPGQSIRVFVVEDDDTACSIRTDPDRFQKLIFAVDSAYNRFTSGNDSSTFWKKYYGYATSAYSVWQRLAALIKSNDELVGNAVEDRIVGTFYPGYNWFVKGENNITNGWINLIMQ